MALTSRWVWPRPSRPKGVSGPWRRAATRWRCPSTTGVSVTFTVPQPGHGLLCGSPGFWLLLVAKESRGECLWRDSGARLHRCEDRTMYVHAGRQALGSCHTHNKACVVFDDW